MDATRSDARPPRATWGRLPDGELLAQCDVDTYRASGPGGQKRHKTSSAVRLRHRPTGLIVIAEESRSQHDNKAKAFRDLPARVPAGKSGALAFVLQVPRTSGPFRRGGRVMSSAGEADFTLVGTATAGK